MGKGAFAEVFKARHLQTGEIYAVKMVDRRKMERMGIGKSMIEKEKNIMLSLIHKNIIRLHDFILTSNNYYFVMEFCPNGDLQNFMKTHAGGKFSEA